MDAECWLSDAAVRAWAREHGHGREWKARLTALFTKRVVRLAAGVGKRVVLWDEAMEMGPHLPEGVALDVWRDWYAGLRLEASTSRIANLLLTRSRAVP